MSAFIDRYKSKSIGGTKKNETRPEVLKKLSHLYLNGKHIDEIGDLSLCENLKVLFLHNNCIKAISNCDTLSNLTHLYLQWNRIRRIENINGLRNLRKLYLGHNEISRLENIEELSNLEELHIERQTSAANKPLNFHFDAASVKGIAGSLKVLNISGLQLKLLCDLQPLERLEELNACDNLFANARDLGRFLKEMPSLMVATFKGCPAQRNDLHYRDKLITSSDALSTLDDKRVLDNARQFLRKLEQAKVERTARELANQNSEAEEQMVEKLTRMFSMDCFDHMESSDFDGAGHDELSFKAWQSLKLRDARNMKKPSHDGFKNEW